MILSKVNYFENKNRKKYWEIKDIYLNKLNLVVGLNAVGKTRMLNALTGLTKLISQRTKTFYQGNWEPVPVLLN